MLDVGAGTGRWALDVCEQLPGALVVGYDLLGHQPANVPAAYRQVRGNALQGLPFATGSFELVHQRFLIAGIPVRSWGQVVGELVRVTAPEGWVEMGESPPWFQAAGPAATRICDLYQRLLRRRGLDGAGVVFDSLDDHLRRAGLTDVARHSFELPIGPWGGEVGSLLATDTRAAMTRVAPIFERELGVPSQETEELVGAMQAEFERYRTSGVLDVTFGRKASGPNRPSADG